MDVWQRLHGNRSSQSWSGDRQSVASWQQWRFNVTIHHSSFPEVTTIPWPFHGPFRTNGNPGDITWGSFLGIGKFILLDLLAQSDGRIDQRITCRPSGWRIHLRWRCYWNTGPVQRRVDRGTEGRNRRQSGRGPGFHCYFLGGLATDRTETSWYRSCDTERQYKCNRNAGMDWGCFRIWCLAVWRCIRDLRMGFWWWEYRNRWKCIVCMVRRWIVLRGPDC